METVDTKSENGIPTNEEIVDSLVKSLESSCQVEREKIDVKDNENMKESLSESSVPLERDENLNGQENDKQKSEEDDFIDEEFLKEQEKSLSEEDRVRLNSEAAELKKTGNEQYKNCQFQEAVTTYTLALRTCPLCYNKDRAMLYANRGAAKLSINLTESAIDDCSKAIELDPDYVKALMRRAQLYEKTDKLDEALADYKRILELDSTHKEAVMANMRLPPLINERNEKLKTEMLGKLKDLGNMVLKPFGLSTNNFQMVPNESGGYSISFKQ
ncbi:tetratricopeptide repeat protein 1-like [Rhodnius prolixus]|uniref:Putative tetratricopeptide repeat protein n=2 Tax=Rhodnius TaxID=13248 RepID=R4FM29_RHOPR